MRERGKRMTPTRDGRDAFSAALRLPSRPNVLPAHCFRCAIALVLPRRPSIDRSSGAGAPKVGHLGDVPLPVCLRWGRIAEASVERSRTARRAIPTNDRLPSFPHTSGCLPMSCWILTHGQDAHATGAIKKKTPPIPPRTGGAFSNRRHENDRRFYPQKKRMKYEG
jgi:hypothetical protein